MKIKALFFIFILGFLLANFVFAQEQLTVTTYYPSPYGVYKELKTTSNSYFAVEDGSVGIGTDSPAAKLDVEGGIKIGNTNLCNASRAGTLRYNSGEMQYCDGSQWKSAFGKGIVTGYAKTSYEDEHGGIGCAVWGDAICSGGGTVPNCKEGSKVVETGFSYTHGGTSDYDRYFICVSE